MGYTGGYTVRQARTRDVHAIRSLVDQNVGSRRLLDKTTVNLYRENLFLPRFGALISAS